MSIQNTNSTHADVDVDVEPTVDGEQYDPFQTAAADHRHSIQRIEVGGLHEIVRCRRCGRTGFPNEITFEFCPATQTGTVGLKTESMAGLPGGRQQ